MAGKRSGTMTDNRTTELREAARSIQGNLGRRLYRRKDIDEMQKVSDLLFEAADTIESIGNGTLTAEQVRDVIERHSMWVNGNNRCFHNGAYEDIADELNSRTERPRSMTRADRLLEELNNDRRINKQLKMANALLRKSDDELRAECDNLKANNQQLHTLAGEQAATIDELTAKRDEWKDRYCGVLEGRNRWWGIADGIYRRFYPREKYGMPIDPTDMINEAIDAIERERDEWKAQAIAAKLGSDASAVRLAERLRSIADEMRSVGASSMTPHELLACYANDVDKVADLLTLAMS